jgi:heat shock protein 1/8
VEAKNKLENYAFSVKNSTNEEALKDKLSADDKASISAAVDDVLKWLDANQSASKDEFDHHYSELEGKVNPIMTKLYQQQQQAGGPSPGYAAGGPSPSSGGRGGPTVEEVD